MAAPAPAQDDRTSLLVLHVLAPAAFGGLEQVVGALTSGLRHLGHDARVAAVLDRDTGDTPLLTRLRDAGVPVTRLEVGPRAYLAERRHLRDVFRTVDPDVVHTHGYRADIQAGTVARAQTRPVVTTVHGFTGGDWKNRVYERLQRHALRKFDAVVAVSRPLCERLVADGVPADRIHLLPNAAPPAVALLSRAAARARLGIPDDMFIAGWVGRLSAEKGPDLFLEALARTAPDVRGAILGTGPAYETLRALEERRGLGARLSWAGVVPDAGSLMAAFDCFVLSSRTEGTPIVLFEAMAANVPIVATAVGGVPDVVSAGEAALVHPDDPDALALAIAGIARDPSSARSRAAAAHRRLVTEREPAPWVAHYAGLYRRLRGFASIRAS
jgi:glycosyltransferase involved in cell wall biosynthesis